MSRKRTRLRKTRMLLSFWLAGIGVPALWSEAARAAPWGVGQLKKHLLVLKQIHAEVQEMGPYPGEDFIRREFFVGEDDDDTNKDIHVTVLIQVLEAKETMMIRVTEMTKDPGNPQARLAGSSRTLSCLIAEGRLEVLTSGYKEEELDKLAPEILTAIRNKKRLLKVNLCESGRPG